MTLHTFFARFFPLLWPRPFSPFSLRPPKIPRLTLHRYLPPIGCPVGNTQWFGTCFVTSLPSGVNDAVTALLPDTKHPDSSLISPNVYVYFTENSNNNMSVTFLQSVAGYTNRMGYAKYANGATSNPVYAIAKTNSNSGSGCMLAGDTWQFGQFVADDMLVFFLDSNSNSNNRYWSYFGPGITNPSADISTCGSPGCTHSAWAYLSDYDLTIFGWEDQSLGDADYNDLVFYLTLQGNGYYNQVPSYENGTVLICNNATIVSWNSFTDVNCQSWGLLETATSGSSCLTYMAIPAGWTWAPNDAVSQNIILQSYVQWSYTGSSTCYLLSSSATAGVGYNVSSSGQLQSCTASVKYITPGGQTIAPSAVTSSTTLCYNTECTARYVLKSLTASVACASVTRCDPAITTGKALSSTPTAFSSGVVSIPDSVTAWLTTGTGSLAVQAAVQLTGTDLTTPKIDVAVLTDFFVDSTSSSGQRGSIDSSWSSVASGFRSLNLNVQFAVVNFVPSSTAATASYSLTSDYTFSTAALGMSSSAYHLIGCGSSSSAILKRGQNLVSAINSVATTSSLNWRSDSYRVIWVHTTCQLPADGSSTTSGVNLRTIQQTTGIVPVISNGLQTQSSVSLAFTSNIPYNYTAYYSGQSATWDSPFRTYAYPPYRGAYLFTQLVKTVQVVASQGDTNWLTGIPSTYTTLSSSGLATVSYNLAWPSTVPAGTSTLYYSTTVQILGRDTVSYLIYFNHAPTLAGYTGTLSTTATSLTFAMTPSDLDQGNLLNLYVVSLPGSTTGTLTASNGSALAVGSTLAYSSYSLVYTPISRSTSYVETFTIGVSDGCKTATATVSITVPKVNQAPVANPVAVTMTEDDLVSGSFALSMTDPDGDSLTAVLSSPAYVSTGTVAIGKLGAGSASSTTYYSSGNVPSSALYYHLTATNGLTGYGTIIIPYQAYDGSLYSATGYITITIAHKNHAPVVSASASVINKVSQTIKFSVSVSDADFAFAGESATIQITSSANWGTGTPAANVAYTITNTGAATYTFSGTGTTPIQFSDNTTYTAPGTNVVRNGNTLTFSGFSWTAPSSAPTNNAQTLTIRAIDSLGGTGSATIIFSLSNTNPPVWQSTPGAVAGSQYQGSTWDGIYFSSHDADGVTPMTVATYTVVTAPANGVAYLQSSTGATSTTALAVGSTFSAQNNGPYAAYNSSGIGFSDFRIRYTGNAAYYGTDTIVLSVTDDTGLSGGNAFATFTTTRRPTPPVSADFAINGYEQALTPFSIAAQSTNDISLPVYIVLESVNFVGSFNQNDGSNFVSWLAGSNSTATVSNGGSLGGNLKGDIGYFSIGSNPAGNFTYRVWEPTNNLLSTATYTASIYITHVNHAPDSSVQTSRIKKRQLLTLRLPASDADSDGTDANLSAAVLAVSPYNGGPTIYYDAALTVPVDAASISAGKRLTDRTLYYKSSEIYDNSLALMTYQFRVFDQYNASSDVYFGYIYVSAAGDLPEVGTNVTSTPQETPVPMQLSSDVTTESGQSPTVTITSLPTKGNFSYCDDFGTCTLFTTGSPALPFTLTSTTGRVVYVPRDNDWGTGFTSFTYTLTDPGTSAVGTYTMVIDVTHVNKPPTIYAANFLTTAQTTAGIVINESEWRSFDWYANDVDDLPSNLTSTIRVSFYTTQGFSFYSCSYVAGAWNSQNCSFTSADVPEAVRADFAKNARITVQNYETVSTDCTDLDVLKLRYGSLSRNCESHFRFAFVPTPLASYTPYVTITWTAMDGAGAESSTISALIFVKAVNNAPTIWAPTQVVGASGITNPFLRDTTVSSSTYNDPISVADVDSSGNIEQMTFQIVSGQGNFTFPAAASCTANGTTAWVCLDRITAFNQWLPDVRFNVTSGDRATLRFIINDLGNSGDYRPSPQLSANATTTVIVSAAIAAPKGNSSTLAIAVGVAAGAGLLLLGALGFFLRNAVSPPDEDYFSAATAPISAAPQSPLYQAQNTEHMSPLYKGNA